MGKKGRGGSRYEKRVRMTRAMGKIALGLLALELVIVIALGIAAVVILMGERRLRRGADSERPSMEGEPVVKDADTEGDADAGELEAVWREGWVRHDGRIYEYNDDILTFLILGIDKMEKVAPNPDKAIAATKNDVTLPVTLYRELKDYIVTDISMDEMAYLAKELIHYRFDADTIYTMEGETVMGEQHESFHPDKVALKDLMIQVFYREVEAES